MYIDKRVDYVLMYKLNNEFGFVLEELVCKLRFLVVGGKGIRILSRSIRIPI